MWDALQREALAALGHVVYRPAGASMPASPSPVSEDGVAPALLRALSRAAGVPVERLSDLPPLEQLRSAAAKRALWPRLRALRAAARS